MAYINVSYASLSFAVLSVEVTINATIAHVCLNKSRL